MPAIVQTTNVAITRIYRHQNKTLHDGSVSYRVKSDSIDFIYTFNFAGAEYVASAVVNGAAYLKGELDALSLATQNVQMALSSP